MTDSFSDGIHETIREAMRGVQRALEEAGVHETDFGDEGQTIEKQFDVGPGAELSVSNVSGEVVVRGEAVSTISIRATKRGSPGRTAATDVSFSHEGNRVTVATKGLAGGLLTLGRGAGRVDYNIVIPVDCSVRVHTVSGEVNVEGVSAQVGIDSVSGDIEVRDIQGDFTSTSVSGDLTVTGLAGVLVVRTTSGDVEVRGGAIPRFNLNSVSGDFEIETGLMSGQHYFARTVSGDLHLHVPPTTGAFVQLRTTSGDVHTELPAEIIKAGRRHWQGRINGGGATVEMTSVSGDLAISAGTAARPFASSQSAEEDVDVPENAPQVPIQASDAPPPAAEAGVEAAESQDGASEVLRLLEQGEITVDEAMQRLDRLNTSG